MAEEVSSENTSMASSEDAAIIAEDLSHLSISTSSSHNAELENTSMAGNSTKNSISSVETSAIFEDLTDLTMLATTCSSDEASIYADALSDSPINQSYDDDGLDFLMMSKSYDFALVVPSKVLKVAIEALSDPTFNVARESPLEPELKKEQHALFEVGSFGCEFTVLNAEAGNRVLGCFQLKAKGLKGFKCATPLKKMITLNDLPRLFRDADVNGYEFLMLYVEEGSSTLSFQWGTSKIDFAQGRPVNIDLHDVIPYENFQKITCVYEADMASEELRALITQLRDIYEEIPDSVAVYLREGVAKMIVDDIQLEEEDMNSVWIKWNVFRDSLEKASELADRCSVYLLTEPTGSILLRFNLGDLGFFAYVTRVHLIQTDSAIDYSN